MPLKAVFFDLDGTLLDTSADLGSALNNVRREQQLPELPHNVIRQHVSNGAGALIKLGFGDNLEDDQHAFYRTRLLDFYLGSIAQYTRPFPGIEDLIARLTEHQLAWGIVTNKPGAYTRALMSYFTFASSPSAVVSPDCVGIGKPAPEPLLHACRLTGCAPDEALYVGDHLRDIQCGHNADMPTIAVGYGFTEAPDEYLHWNATHTARTADDIWPVIQTYL